MSSNAFKKEPAEEDMRALAQVQAAMMIAAKDPKTLEGWTHASADSSSSSSSSSEGELARAECEGLKKENARLVALVADLRQQLDDVTGLASRMMAAEKNAGASGVPALTYEVAEVKKGRGGGIGPGLVSNGLSWVNPWVTEGDGRFCQRVTATIPNAHLGFNVLCTRLHPGFLGASGRNGATSDLVASGGADKTVRVHNWRFFAVAAATGAGAAKTDADSVSQSNASSLSSMPASLACSAPPLCLEWQPVPSTGGSSSAAASAAGSSLVEAKAEPLLAIACMDGTLGLARLEQQQQQREHQEGAGPLSLEWVFEMSASSSGGHKKHVNAMQWSPDGAFLCTASADRAVKLWRFDPKAAGAGAAGAEIALACVKSWHLDSAVEALCFLPQRCFATTAPPTAAAAAAAGTGTGSDSSIGKGGSGTLVLAPRGYHSLIYVDPISLEETEVPLNAASWDRHVSFNVLHLTPSPDGAHLLAATDANRHIVYPAGSNKHARLLVGHAADEFSKPRAAWDPSGRYVLSNSQAEGLHQVLVWCLAQEKVVCRLGGSSSSSGSEGHSGAVRDVHHHPTCSLLATASYDHSVKIWEPAVN